MLPRTVRALSSRFGRASADESGQAMVLFGLAMTVMLGFLALIVDVGQLHVQRRRAQAVADTAAVVGAQNWAGLNQGIYIRQAEGVQDARRYAVKNGFSTDPGANEGWNGDVMVQIPPSSGLFAGQSDYIEVRVRRDVPALFAGIVGQGPFQVEARAVARARHQSFQSATISLSPNQGSTTSMGVANTLVVGGTYSRGETKSQGAGGLSVGGSVWAHGGVTGAGISASGTVVGDAPDLRLPTILQPATAPTGPGGNWNGMGLVPELITGYVYIDPGTYGRISISPGMRVRFRSGVYRLTNQGITINGEATAFDGPVLFILENNAKFDAQASGIVNFWSDDIYNNIVIYASCTASTAGDPVKLTGATSITLSGTIYTPCGDVQVAGTAGGTVHGQVIANTISLSGGAGPAVIYDTERTPDIPGPSLVE